jgi:hypothetical protein
MFYKIFSLNFSSSFLIIIWHNYLASIGYKLLAVCSGIRSIVCLLGNCNTTRLTPPILLELIPTIVGFPGIGISSKWLPLSGATGIDELLVLDCRTAVSEIANDCPKRSGLAPIFSPEGPPVSGDSRRDGGLLLKPTTGDITVAANDRNEKLVLCFGTFRFA